MMTTEDPLNFRQTNAFYANQESKLSLWAQMKEQFMGCAIGESFTFAYKSRSKLVQIRNQISIRSKEYERSYSVNVITEGQLRITRIEYTDKEAKLWASIEEQFLNCPETHSFNVELKDGQTQNALRSLVSKRAKQNNMKYSVQSYGDNVYRLVRLPLVEPNPVDHFPAWLAWRFDNTPKESYTLLELAEAFQAGVTTGVAK